MLLHAAIFRKKCIFKADLSLWYVVLQYCIKIDFLSLFHWHIQQSNGQQIHSLIYRKKQLLIVVIVKICREAFRSINKPPKEPQEKFAFPASLFGSKLMIVLSYLVIQKKRYSLKIIATNLFQIMFLLRTQSFKKGLLLNSISLGILITVYTTICCNSIPTMSSTRDTLKSE